jgi:amidase
MAEWETIASQHRAECLKKIPNEWKLPSSALENLSETNPISVVEIPRTCGLLSDREIDITETRDAHALIERIAAKEFSAIEVATAFCKRAAIAQQLVRLSHTVEFSSEKNTY